MGARVRSDLRCVHCQTQETPLWRAGPSGPKTLCNACGVRWKKTGSVIPRPKRPAPPPAPTAPPTQAPVRKRTRTVATDAPRNERALATALADAAARAAACAPLPAPKAVSVFRMADSSRPKYESVFSGLMVVPRADADAASEPGVRTRTHTPKGTVYFGDFSAPAPAPRLDLSAVQPRVAPCASPPPGDDGDGGVYVTETHYPSPSPSPPPMPRVTRGEGGAGLRVVLAAVADRGDGAGGEEVCGG